MLQIGFSGDKRVQHGTARDAQHVCDHVRELDIGRFQQLVHAVGGFDPIPDEALPMSRERESRIGGGGMKLRMSPCARRFAIRAVLHIGLPARHGLHVVRIGQDYLEAPPRGG